MDTVTLSKANKDLDGLMDQAVETGQPVVIKRKGKPDVALVAVSNLKVRKSRKDDEYLFRSPKNAGILTESMAQADAGIFAFKGTLEELAEKFGVDFKPARKKAKRPAAVK